MSEHRSSLPHLCLLLIALAAGAGCDSSIEPMLSEDDRIPPHVSATSPADDAQAVSTRQPISVTFSEPIDARTVTPRNFRVSVLGAALPGAIIGDGRRYTFVPEDSLPGNRHVEVTIRQVADMAGNAIAGDHRFSFHTAGDDPPPPGIPSTPDPTDGDTGVPIDPLLAWVCACESGQTITYDVWLGTGIDELSELASGLTAAQFRCGALQYETEYSWRVIAHTPGGQTSSPIWTFTTRTNPDPGNRPPFAPCDPRPEDGALAVRAQDVTLDWECDEDPDGDRLTFDIYLGTSTDPPLLAETSAPPLTPDEPLAPASVYYWRVVADDGRGGMTTSPTWTFHTRAETPQNGPPSAPAEPITPADGATTATTTVLLTWSGGNDPDRDPVSYTVRLGTTDPPPDFATVEAKQLEVEGLTHSTQVFWQIVARDDHDHQVEGPVWKFRTPDWHPPNQPPSPPCDPQPANGSTDVPATVTLSWGCGDDPDDDPVEYVVFLEKDDANDPDSVAAVSAKSFSTRLDPYAIYYWRIEARDGHGGRASSPTWVFLTTPLPPPNRAPSAPCDPQPVDGSTDVPAMLSLGWGCGDDPDGDSVEYVVFLAESGVADPDSVATVSEKSYLTVLAQGVTYSWRIEARDGHGGNTSSPIWTFTTTGGTNGPPSTPREPINPPDGSTTTEQWALLTWSGGDDPDADPVTYEVRFGTTTPPGFFTSVTTKELLVLDLPDSTEHYWQIVAHDDHGHDAAGPIWQFRTPALPPMNVPPSAPCTPYPSDGGTDVSTDLTLRWGCGDDPDGDDVVYVVFLEAGDGSDPDSVATVYEKSYAVTLDHGTTYHWRIEARDERGGTASSELWSFTTEPENLPPRAPYRPTPSDGRTRVSLSPNLKWRCSDPEGNPLVYTIYFGTSTDPDSLATTSEREYRVRNLDGRTTYYWRIVAADDHGNATSGPLWSFTTEDD